MKQQLIIAVSDTGMGIPLDKQEWVFERFTKIDSFKPGTGLGLSQQAFSANGYSFAVLAIYSIPPQKGGICCAFL